MSSSEPCRLRRRGQRGSTAVEFAIVIFIFLTVVFAMIDFARWLFAMNSANEAAREGARVAVVCDIGDADITARMAPFLLFATGGTATIAYTPSGCTRANCQGVTVSLSNYTVPRIGWLIPVPMGLPAAKTYLSRESLDSLSNTNPRCDAP